MGDRIPLTVEETGQGIPHTSRKVYIAVDENGLRIGETHHNAKLTDAQVDQLRDLHEQEGWTARRLAEHFGITYIAARKICTYERQASTIAGWKVILLHTPVNLTPKEES